MKAIDILYKCDIYQHMETLSYLTPEEKQTLRAAHRQEKNRRVADRIKCILLADEGWSYRMIAKALLLDEQTISEHVSEYISKQKLKLDSGGSKSKLDSQQATELISHLELNTYFKVKDICAYVLEKFNILYTVQGMTSWLHINKFSYKKPKKTPAKADGEKQKEFIKKYKDLLATTAEDEPILFGDGVHPTMATKVTSGWIRTGEDKPIATTASRTRINLFGAINLSTMGIIFDHYKTIDSVSMVDFFLF
jgi:transposase